MGLVVSKTRSLCRILDRPCVRSRDLILVQILMKLGQNYKFENGSCGV